MCGLGLNSAKSNSRLVSKQWQATNAIFLNLSINLLLQFISQHADWSFYPLFIKHTHLPFLNWLHQFFTGWTHITSEPYVLVTHLLISLCATFSSTTKKHITLLYGTLVPRAYLISMVIHLQMLLNSIDRCETCYTHSFRYPQCYPKVSTISVLPFSRIKSGKLT